jgi:glycosyltransferase involved in cell wall biosynthesis
MKISFTTVSENLQTANGFGIAGFNIVTTLQKLGHEIPFQDPTAPVEFAFVQPDRVEWSGTKARRILYVPWESDKIPDGWRRGIESANELWTTSDKCKEWFERNGYDISVVYPHGINPMWSLKPRKRSTILKFLAVGEPAVRKNGQLIYDAFVEAFGDQTDVLLTIKAHTMSTIRDKESILPQNAHKNVRVITTELQDEEMVTLHHSHHVSVTASSGEGFGLIPLQAMATGMPTICVPDWAHYKDLLLPKLRLNAMRVGSPWPDIHPGTVYWPSKEHLVQTLRYTYNNFEQLSYQAQILAPVVHRKYDWKRLTEEAFSNITTL